MSKKNRLGQHGLVALSCTLAFICLASVATAQPTGVYMYTVDFVCGYQASNDGDAGYEPLVKVANYATKIDVHNYHGNQANLAGDVQDTTSITWTMSAPPQSLAATTLMPGHSTVLDCSTIVSTLNGSLPATGKPFFNGVATVRSDQPLIVWATKTTEVCAGLATFDESENPEPVLTIGPDGLPIPGPSGPLPAPVLSLLGCPSATLVQGGPQGPYLAPGGSVTPGLRPPGIIRSQQTGDLLLADISVSHSVDFERVEGVFIELP